MLYPILPFTIKRQWIDMFASKFYTQLFNPLKLGYDNASSTIPSPFNTFIMPIILTHISLTIRFSLCSSTSLTQLPFNASFNALSAPSSAYPLPFFHPSLPLCLNITLFAVFQSFSATIAPSRHVLAFSVAF